MSACESELVPTHHEDGLGRMSVPPWFDTQAYLRRSAFERLVGRP